MVSRIQVVKSRKGFYRDHYNRACVGLLVTLGIILTLNVLVVYLTIFSSTPDCYASAQDGRLTPLIAQVLDSHKVTGT